ncbi:phosphotransferase [Mycolicibacterium thermoresistibile]
MLRPALTVPPQWEDVTAEWMTAALRAHHRGTTVKRVVLTLRDDGTNRRARFELTYATGAGPRRVFVKAESGVPGRREIHFRNGNLFNESRLYQALIDGGTDLPLEHPRAYAVGIDEEGLDYVMVLEDLLDRGADPRDPTRPLSVDQVANGLRGLARLHSRHWIRVADDPALAWVQPFRPTRGWTAPMTAALPRGLAAAERVLPEAVNALGAAGLVAVWTDYVTGLTAGPPTLLHGDPHIGNTYLLPDDEVGFLDWQVVRSGNWSHDVGYFLQSALTVTDRRDHEADLVAMYRDALQLPEHRRPGPDETWLRYRASPAHGLPVWLITLLSDVHPTERSHTLVERFAAAFADLDTPAAVQELRPS